VTAYEKESSALGIILVEDEPVFMLGLEATLEFAEPPVKILAKVTAADEAVAAAREQLPDVIMIDLRIPIRVGPFRPSEANGIQAIAQISRAVPSVRILVLSYLDESDVLFEALSAGAHGYISKGDRYDGNDLARAIHLLAAGETIYGPTIAERIRAHYQRSSRDDLIERLTRREREILDLLVKRKTNHEIADALVISVKTVKTHVSNILAKLQIERRQEAVWLDRERNKPDA
jgi:two-component system, NarL family, response regulator LiaR